MHTNDSPSQNRETPRQIREMAFSLRHYVGEFTGKKAFGVSMEKIITGRISLQEIRQLLVDRLALKAYFPLLALNENLAKSLTEGNRTRYQLFEDTKEMGELNEVCGSS